MEVFLHHSSDNILCQGPSPKKSGCGSSCQVFSMLLAIVKTEQTKDKEVLQLPSMTATSVLAWRKHAGQGHSCQDMSEKGRI